MALKNEVNFNLKNKVILVTGSSRGIGLSISHTLREEGSIVCQNSRNCKNTKNSIRADVTEENECQTLIDEVIKQHGRLDALVCNVGEGSSIAPGFEKKADWESTFNKNLFSATTLVEMALPHLKKVGGSIVCITSACGSEYFQGAPFALMRFHLEIFYLKVLFGRPINVNALS